MNKSLYWKFVSTFILVVILSLMASFLITSSYLQDRRGYEVELERMTSAVVDSFTHFEGDNYQNIVEIFQDFGLHTTVLSENEAMTYVSGDGDVSVIPLAVSRMSAYQIDDLEAPLYRALLLPIDGQASSDYIFVEIDPSHSFQESRTIMTQTLLLVLLIGSLSILYVSRYFVKSIHVISHALEKVAGGNYDVNLETDRQDEIGLLMRRFNEMTDAVQSIDEMRKTFVSNVSHEIQSPLTSIKGYTKAIQDGVISPEEMEVSLAVIYQEADRLSRLSESLLRLASLDSEKHPFHPKPYRLDEQIRRVIVNTEPMWRAKGLTISFDMEPLTLELDEDLMEQVWINLISNAIKYNDKEGSVHINHFIDDHEHVISIKDTGIGIEESDLPHIFERFYKVDQARTSNQSGTGLGLSIVRRILRLHRARIEIISKPKIGTTCLVHLPNN